MPVISMKSAPIKHRLKEIRSEQTEGEWYMTICKTVNVTNPRNVLVQIPAFIAGATWRLKQGDKLEVLYNEATQEVTIRPAVR